MRRSVLPLLLGSRRRALATALGWLIALGVLAQLAPTLDSVEDNASANLPPAASDSMRARDLLAAAFPERTGTPALVVIGGADSAPGTVAGVAGRIEAALTGPDGPEGVTGAVSAGTTPGPTDGLVSADGRTQVVIAAVSGSPSDESFRQTVADVRALADDLAGDTAVAVTGPAGIATDTTAVFSSGDRTLLLGTVLVILVILLLVYGAPLLALLPLLAVGVAMRLAETLGALMAGAGWFDISSQTASIMTVLLFGVGTDYALIITARYREALLDEPDRYRAMHSALRGVGEVVLSSASTIVLAMLALLVSVSPALRGFGPYLALGVASMAVVAFTFFPALVLLAGRAVFWPAGLARATRRGRDGRIWRGVAGAVIAAPARVATAVVVTLLVGGLGLIGYQTSFDFVSGFRVDTDSARGQTMVREGLGAGEIAPATVVVHSPEGRVTPDALDRVAAALAEAGPVARVDPRPRLSDDGHTGAITVVLDSDPYGSEALDGVPGLERTARDAARAAGVPAAEVVLGGETAQTADIRAALDRDMQVLVPVVLGIVALVLGLLLHSVLAPLYLVATVVLSFLATMGVTTFVTVTVLGDDGIGNRVTAYVFVFLVALGIDYNIFIMSRLRQELRRRPAVEALRTAVVRTGGVVSSAGLILAATFAVLMTQPIRELFQFGFAMAVGILLDTFLIRPLLVPAIVRLLGGAALWPSRLAAGTPETAAEAPAPVAAERTA